jgi:hypothetical protein
VVPAVTAVMAVISRSTDFNRRYFRSGQFPLRAGAAKEAREDLAGLEDQAVRVGQEAVKPLFATAATMVRLVRQVRTVRTVRLERTV